jgi:hypothetical protein
MEIIRLAIHQNGNEMPHLLGRTVNGGEHWCLRDALGGFCASKRTFAVERGNQSFRSSKVMLASVERLGKKILKHRRTCKDETTHIVEVETGDDLIEISLACVRL